MNEQEFDTWAKSVKKVFYQQIMLDDMKKSKKFKRKDLKIAEGKIKILRYRNHINSPMFEGKPELKEKIKLRLFEDAKRFLKIKE